MDDGRQKQGIPDVVETRVVDVLSGDSRLAQTKIDGVEGQLPG